MKLNGRKHGFRIGSGRTVKHGLRLKTLNVDAYRWQFFGAASQLLDEAQVQIFVEHNQGTFDLRNGRAVPKSEDSTHEMLKQERARTKRARQLIRKRQV